MNQPVSFKCATHPEVETTLRCGKCGKPICPKCLVQTPVGARCRDCAGLYKLPTYRVSPVYYLRAAGAALGTGAALGAAWGFLGKFFATGFFSLLIAAGIGWVIGEVTGLATNRKRGLWLAVIGGIAVVVCYGVYFFISGQQFGVGIGLAIDIAAIVIGIVSAVSRLR
jgi:hypothetical protein